MLAPPRALLVLSLGLLAFVAPAQAAPAQAAPQTAASTQRATFGIQPANAIGQPDTRPYLNYDVTPSATLKDNVLVVNYSTIALRLAVYATDAENDNKGGFALLPAAIPPRDAGTWIAVGTPGGTGLITVPARSRVLIPLHISIPANATPGDHVAGIVVSLTAVKQTTGERVRLDQRVATRVFIRVSGPLTPSLLVQQIRGHYDNQANPMAAGKATVRYRVTNNGNVSLAGLQSLKLHGLLGSTTTLALPDLPLLLPGSSVTFTAHLPHVWPEFRETATISIRPLIIPGDATPGLRLYSGQHGFWAIPWISIAIVLALILAVTVGVRRRRRPAPLALTPVGATV